MDRSVAMVALRRERRRTRRLSMLAALLAGALVSVVLASALMPDRGGRPGDLLESSYQERPPGRLELSMRIQGQYITNQSTFLVIAELRNTGGSDLRILPLLACCDGPAIVESSTGKWVPLRPPIVSCCCAWNPTDNDTKVLRPDESIDFHYLMHARRWDLPPGHYTVMKGYSIPEDLPRITVSYWSGEIEASAWLVVMEGG